MENMNDNALFGFRHVLCDKVGITKEESDPGDGEDDIDAGA